MKITWIDSKSVLRLEKKVYGAGMEIPADKLSKATIDMLTRNKKIRIGDGPKKTTATTEIFGREVEATITGEAAKKKKKKPKEDGDDNSPEG